MNLDVTREVEPNPHTIAPDIDDLDLTDGLGRISNNDLFIAASGQNKHGASLRLRSW